MKNGISPTAWSSSRLDSVAQVRTGIAKGSKSPKQPISLPYLRVANVQDGRLDLREIKQIEVDQAEVARYSLQPGDVLMTEGGDFDKLGRGTIWQGQITSCLHQNHIFAVRCDPHKVLPEWISLVASSQYGRRYFQLCSKQSTNLASINSSQLKAFPVPLPKLKEQRVLVEASLKFEDLLSGLSSLHVTKTELKRGLAQRLLSGQQRFPEFRGHPWHSSPLGDHVKTVTRKNSIGVNLVLTASGEHGLVDQRRYFKRRIAASDVSRYCLLRKGEFAYNRSAMSGYPYGATKRLDAHEEGALSTLYLCFAISDENLDSDFLKHVLESSVLNRQLRPIVRVGARAHGLLNISDEDFLSINIPFPGIGEQRRIAQLLNQMDQDADLLVAQREQVRLYKRGFLARLLPGASREKK